MRDRDLAIRLYNEVHKADEPRTYRNWHASAIAKCPREHYFLRAGVPGLRDIGAAKKLRWQVGHEVETAIRPYVTKLFPNLVSNMRLVDDELDLTGEMDNYSPSEKRIIEIKSVHPFAFSKGEDSGLRDEEPYLHHRYQQHAYALLLDRAGFPVEGISYVYIALDGRIDTYTVDLSDSITEQVVNRLENLNLAWRQQNPPTCICHDTEHPLYKAQMQYCEYKTEGGCCDLSLLEGVAA